MDERAKVSPRQHDDHRKDEEKEQVEPEAGRLFPAIETVSAAIGSVLEMYHSCNEATRIGGDDIADVTMMVAEADALTTSGVVGILEGGAATGLVGSNTLGLYMLRLLEQFDW